MATTYTATKLVQLAKSKAVGIQMTITVAFGTLTPTSITVVDTKI